MQNMLTGWGIPPTKQLSNLIARMVKAGAGSAQILQSIRKTKDYAQAFPGIRRRDGSMRMSEAQYISGFNTAKDYASTIGRGLSKGAYGMAIKNGNSPSEIKSKLQADDIMKQNSEVFQEFGQYLVDTGVVKKPPTKEELRKFIMKQGPKAWEKAYQTAYTASQIEKYGGLGDFDIGKGDALGYHGLEKLIKQAPPGTDPTKIDWREMAKTAAEVLPASRLYGLGITKTDMIKLQLGTPEAVKIESRAKLASATAAAFGSEQRAANQLNQGGLQTGKDDKKLQATE